MQSVDPGFVADDVLTLRTQLPAPRYDDSVRRTQFYQRVLAGVGAIPSSSAYRILQLWSRPWALMCYSMRISSHIFPGDSPMALARTNLTLPEDLLAAVDELAGPRGRSRYVAEAVAQRVKRDKLGKAIRETAGIMVGSPGWMSPDEVVRWVDFLRSEETD